MKCIKIIKNIKFTKCRSNFQWNLKKLIRIFGMLIGVSISQQQQHKNEMPYLNILPRSREEHAKMIGARHQEANRKVKPVPKPTQLLFTNNNNMYDFYAPSIRSTDHFLKFVKNK